MGKWEDLREHIRSLQEDEDYSVFALELLDTMDNLEAKYAEIENDLGYKPNEYNEGRQ